MIGSHWIDRGDLWKSKARFLQLQLRQKFRVAVDRGARRPAMFSGNGYFYLTTKRWLQRFRNFRRDSLVPSSKRVNAVSMDFFAEEESIITRMLQAVAVPVLGNICYVFMHGFNHVHVYGAEKLHQAILHRPKDKALVTVSNHVASMDDPLVIASLLPPHILMDAQNLRWTLCATDRCFKNPVTSAFFRSVKVLPVSRGSGIYQKGLDLAISKLNHGGWVHIFPEGSRSRDGGRTVGSAKKGVGRLVLDANHTPIVVPFVHTGMQDIMPVGSNLPKIGKAVTILIGDPIQFDDLFDGEYTDVTSRESLCGAVSSRVGERLRELKIQVDRLSLEQSLKIRQNFLQNRDRSAGILEQIDWELLGLRILYSDNDSSLEPDEQTKNHPCQAYLSDSYFRMGFCDNGGIVSRIRDLIDCTEFMGFAAKGLSMTSRQKNKNVDVGEFTALDAWKQFFKSNVQRCNYVVVA